MPGVKTRLARTFMMCELRGKWFDLGASVGILGFCKVSSAAVLPANSRILLCGNGERTNCCNFDFF